MDRSIFLPKSRYQVVSGGNCLGASRTANQTDQQADLRSRRKDRFDLRPECFRSLCKTKKAVGMLDRQCRGLR